MGKFDGKYIRGMVGPIVQRKTKHGLVIQTRPGKVRQTQGTKKAQGVFGQASTLAAVIRKSLIYATQDNADADMVNRFNGPVRDVLHQCYNKETAVYAFQENSFERLAGLEFNIKSLLINYLLVRPEMWLEANMLKVRIPELIVPDKLKYPGGTNICEFRIAVTTIALHGSMIRDIEYRSFEVQIDQNVFPEQEFEFVADAGCLCVAGIGLNYYMLDKGIKTEYNSKKFNPSNLIAAVVTPGVFVEPPLRREGNKVYGSPWSRLTNLDLPVSGE